MWLISVAWGLIFLVHLSGGIFVLVTNKVLICSTYVLYYVVVASSDCSQMVPSPPKKKTPAKKADKRLKMDSNLFRSVQHFERYKDSFMTGTII